MEQIKNLITQNNLDLSFLVKSYRENLFPVRELYVLKYSIKDTIKNRNIKIKGLFLRMLLRKYND